MGGKKLSGPPFLERSESMKRMRNLSFLLIIFTFFLSCSPRVHAEELAAGFTIEGVPNERQIDKNVGYFFLKETAGMTDEIKVKLINDSDNEKRLLVNIVDANTNVNGLVDYTGKIENHKDLKTPLTSIVEASQKEVVVPKKGEVETTLKLKMPTPPMEGVIVGGVVVSEKIDEKQKKNMAIGNTYSYTLGIVLSNDEKTPIKRNVSLELDSVGAKLFDGKKIVQANIVNKNPYIFEDATITGGIYNKDTRKTVIKTEKKNIEMAPYSSFPFQFDWGKKTLEPGKYSFVGEAVSGDKKWNFEKDFEITGSQAKKINSETVFKIYIPTWFKVVSIILAIIALVGTLWIFIRKQKRG